MVILLSVFIGLTMALLTGYQLQRFGTVMLVPAIVSVSFTREMGPLFTGIVLASRIGAAYTAELLSLIHIWRGHEHRYAGGQGSG